MTGIYATIKLDPFLQQFLRGYFECDEIVFSFPRCSRKFWLPIAFKAALWYPPENYKPQSFGEETFKIEIPEMKDKDPSSHNHISARANQEFVSAVKFFYDSVAYSFFDEMKYARFGAKSIITLFIDRYSIDPAFEDRIARDYSRYNNTIKCKTFREKIKKNTKKISISVLELA